MTDVMFTRPVRNTASAGRYRVDLAAYMRTCDINYMRLLKLIPALESKRGRSAGHTAKNELDRLCQSSSYSSNQSPNQSPNESPANRLINNPGMWEFLLGMSDNGRPPIRITIRLLEAFAYTSTLEIKVQSGFPAWSPAPVIHVRMYHDAATAEPVSYQGHRQIPARCKVPNVDMYHQDEKRQINEFLAEWLRICVNSGISAKASDILCID